MVFVNYLDIKSPKRAGEKEKRASWYNYYAGFSHTFVRDVINSLSLSEKVTVLDPWNGSGATTYAAALEGHNTIGIDLNPPMFVVARSKFSSRNDVLLAIKRLKYLRINSNPISIDCDDYLLNWFDKPTASYLRYIDCYISGGFFKSVDDKLNSFDNVSCVSYLSLFNSTRVFISKFIASNPTWIKKTKDPSKKINIPAKMIKSLILDFLAEMLETTLPNFDNSRVEILCSDSKKLPLNDGSIDLIITSPPYCTRIDYGIATSPELAILFGYMPNEIENTRRSLIGRTTIDKMPIKSELFGELCSSFLNDVYNHSSISSATYYHKNLHQYFYDMKSSISELSRVVRTSGKFVCVVQDSFYKEIYCNLPEIINEMAVSCGFYLVNKLDFDTKINMANINKVSKKYRDKTPAIESVLIFSRG